MAELLHWAAPDWTGVPDSPYFSVCLGQLGVRAHLVRGLPGEELLPEEPADERDAHRHAVPFLVLDGPRDPQLGQDPVRLPQVK